MARTKEKEVKRALLAQAAKAKEAKAAARVDQQQKRRRQSTAVASVIKKVKSGAVVAEVIKERAKRRRGNGNLARQRIYALQKEDARSVLQKADFKRLLGRVHQCVLADFPDVTTIASDARQILQFVTERLLLGIIGKAGERTIERERKTLRKTDFLSLKKMSNFVVDPAWIPDSADVA